MDFRIVLFDDNDFFRQSLHDLLHQHFPDIDIRQATNSEECLSLLVDASPDILFLDLQFHDVDGLNLIKRIRQDYPATVIVILTEYDMNEYRSATLMAGGNYVIPKTLWTGNEILALVRTILTNMGFPRAETESWLVGEQDFLRRPLERRRNILTEKGRVFERNYLKHHPDRRRKLRPG